MLHIVKTTNLIIKRTPLLCGLLFAAMLALLPVSAQAQCKNWDAGGEWEIKQRGQVNGIILTLEQTGRVLNGKADTYLDTDSFFEIKRFIAPVDGTIDGDSLSIQIYWPNRLVGVYNGKVRPSGRLEGEAYEKSTPNSRQEWHSQGVLRCAPPTAPPPIKSSGKAKPTPPVPKPIKSSGKMPKSAPAAPSPPMMVPGIIASQVIFEPGYPTGFVSLTWDGGPDHPYAEVWVKVGEGDETFVVEQDKGERRVIVERNKTYLYILTDAGKTLSTARVNVPPN